LSGATLAKKSEQYFAASLVVNEVSAIGLMVVISRAQLRQTAQMHHFEASFAE
jgi:hypothetical protein